MTTKVRANSVIRIQNFPDSGEQVNGQIAIVKETDGNYVIATTGWATFKLHLSQYVVLIP